MVEETSIELAWAEEEAGRSGRAARRYKDLIGLFPIVRTNHAEAYVPEPGASTNQAESFFSRIRRAALGVTSRAVV